MNEKLYESLVKAHSVLEKKEELEKKLDENIGCVERYEKQNEESKAEIEKLKKFGPDGRLRCGIIFTFIGFVLTLLGIISSFGLPINEVALGFLFALPPLITGIILLILFFREKRQVKKKIKDLKAFVESYKNGAVNQVISQCRSEAEKLKAELNDFISSNSDYISFIPSEVQKAKSVLYMIECVKEQLADTQKAAFMLAAMYDRIENLENIVETQKFVLEALSKRTDSIEKEFFRRKSNNGAANPMNIVVDNIADDILDGIF